MSELKKGEFEGPTPFMDMMHEKASASSSNALVMRDENLSVEKILKNHRRYSVELEVDLLRYFDQLRLELLKAIDT